jgi:hypothetical protein
MKRSLSCRSRVKPLIGTYFFAKSATSVLRNAPRSLGIVAPPMGTFQVTSLVTNDFVFFETARVCFSR